MNRQALDRLVNEHVALNAAAEGGARSRKYPPQTRFLIDMAKAGTCGQPAEARQQKAPVAQELGDFLEERAVAEPLKDLAYILRTAADDPESHELCARGVGAAWRAEHPFRKGRPGDPLDVLLPHVSDEMAVLALDRARTLPKAPVPLMRRADEIDRYLKRDMPLAADGAPLEPFSRSLASALLETARYRLEALLPEVQKIEDTSTTRKLREDIALVQKAQRSLRTASPTSWYEPTPPVIPHGLETAISLWHTDLDDAVLDTSKQARRATEYAQKFNTALSDLRCAEQALHAAHNSLVNTRKYTGVSSARLDAYEQDVTKKKAKVERLRHLFSDFYPDET